MAMSVARLYRALPWLLVTAFSMALPACSGTTEESPGSGSAVSSAPTSNPANPSDPTPPPADTTPPPVPFGPGAATDTVLSLTWQPNADPIAGYIVYYGPTPDGTNTLAVQLSLASNPFNGQTPNVSFNAGTDLGLNRGDSVCFRLRAYNSVNTLSGWSAAACGTI